MKILIEKEEAGYRLKYHYNCEDTYEDYTETFADEKSLTDFLEGLGYYDFIDSIEKIIKYDYEEVTAVDYNRNKKCNKVTNRY